MTETSGELRAWLANFVSAELRHEATEASVKRFASAILARCPELGSDPHLHQLMRSAAQAHWTRFLSDLLGTPHEIHLVQPAAELAAEIARRRIPLTTLYTMYRVALESTWDYITQMLGDLPPDVEPSEFLVFFWSRASEWLNGSVGPSVEVYEAERKRLGQGSKARRLELILNVLDGRAPEASRVSAELGGFPISGFSTALILFSDTHDSLSTLETAALRLSRTVGAHHPLTVPPSDRELWCWLSSTSPLDLKALLRSEPLLSRLRVRATVGTSVSGLAGFVRSHHEAVAARAHCERTGSPAAVTCYEDVEILVLLDKDPEAAMAFARRTLGPLADDTVTAARLRETALSFLSHVTANDAAAALEIHTNTVRYRLAKVEEILGGPVSRNPVELALAIRYFNAFANTTALP
ncbi:PucR-like helix-turn-helix protein [Actinocorallia herbida]|uniref:PucR-like helix-turn-helix protein n=1 Tax=Actinocorallia herbida TaxID=58109 RepID=A0A3N1D2S7_9ACTN|nr:helix-turn-helix domain-containing protein [Actinocorallia herbida]ROO87845.1 PucR-like helix-turn-helix protein [Actinocorallia herbida]